MIVKYNGNEIELKVSLRSTFLFERLVRQMGVPEGTLEAAYLMYYCVMCTSHGDSIGDYDSFLDWCESDEGKQAFSDYIGWREKLNNDKKKAMKKE